MPSKINFALHCEHTKSKAAKGHYTFVREVIAGSCVLSDFRSRISQTSDTFCVVNDHMLAVAYCKFKNNVLLIIVYKSEKRIEMQYLCYIHKFKIILNINSRKNGKHAELYILYKELYKLQTSSFEYIKENDVKCALYVCTSYIFQSVLSILQRF
jgi:hypothetical protein